MRAGQLRHRGQIMQPPTTRNTKGEKVGTWSLFAERWISIEPFQGSEEFRAEQYEGIVLHRIKMRNLDGIKPEFQIWFTDRTSAIRKFDIISILDPLEFGTERQVIAREVVD